MKLSEMQLSVVNADDGNMIVCAGAGSGKTRVLVERVKRLIKSGANPDKVVIITYTNNAADELISRLKDTKDADKCFIGTIHSYAYKLLRRTNKDFEIFSEVQQTKFMKYLIDKYGYRCTFHDYEEFLKYERLASIGKIQQSRIAEKFSDISVYNEIIGLLGRGTSYAYKETVKTLCRDNNVLTFDDLIEQVTQNGEIPHIEHLFVDEFQDVGYLEYNFLMWLNADQYFVIGDDYQCQPFGTKVTLDDGELVNIEDIKVDDYVMSYSKPDGYYRKKRNNARGCRVLSKQVSISDRMIHIETCDGRKTSYTPNHRCLARINYDDNTKDMHVVYIMMDSGKRFRVGSTQLFVDGGRNFGVRNRMNAEHGIHSWILGVYKTAKDAWLCEQLCAYKYGIPQVTWAHQNATFSLEDIHKLYEELGDLRDKAAKCLSDFGRDIDYPLFIHGTNTHFSKLHITEVRACNLIPGVMDLAYPSEPNDKGREHNEYITISSALCEYGQFDVVALEIETTGIYVADGFITHNSIFGFNGGDVQIFLSLMNNDDWKSYYLTENYRTAKMILSYAMSVIKKANDIIDKTVIPMRKEQGQLNLVGKALLESSMSEFKKGDWFILTRTNKELSYLCSVLKQHNMNFVCLKHGEVVESGGDSDNKNIVAMTVHTAKGMECDNVAIYGKFPIAGKGQSDELKVFYVALTRAKDRCLVFV